MSNLEIRETGTVEPRETAATRPDFALSFSAIKCRYANAYRFFGYKFKSKASFRRFKRNKKHFFSASRVSIFLTTKLKARQI